MNDEDVYYDDLTPPARAALWLLVWLGAIVLVLLSALALKVLLWAMG